LSPPHSRATGEKTPGGAQAGAKSIEQEKEEAKKEKKKKKTEKEHKEKEHKEKKKWESRRVMCEIDERSRVLCTSCEKRSKKLARGYCRGQYAMCMRAGPGALQPFAFSFALRRASFFYAFHSQSDP
jgi:hypothetical protein